MWSGVVVFQSVSHVWLLVTPTECGAPGFMAPWPSLSPGVYSKLILWASDAIQPSHPLLPPSSLAVTLAQPASGFFFQWVSSSHQVTKYWSFSFSISPSNEYSGLIYHVERRVRIICEVACDKKLNVYMSWYMDLCCFVMNWFQT